MKKLVLLTAMLVGIIGIAQSKHVYIHKEGRGFWGYGNVTYVQDGADIWVDCCGPGKIRCITPKRPAPGEGGLDAVDITQLYDLADYGSEQMDNGTLSGCKTVRVQVEGENFERLYKVTWVSADEYNGEVKSERLDDLR